MPAWTGRTIGSRSDVHTVLADMNQQGLTRANTTALAEAVRPAGDVELQPDASKLLALSPELHGLLPWPGGLRKGATVATVGSTSLLMLLLAAATREGWAAVVGMPHFGALAARELGCNLERLALVPEPGPDWPTVVGALMDGVDLVAVSAPAGVSDGTVRALKARARERGCILVPTAAWAGSDLVMQVTGRQWTGLGQGGGRLRQQQLKVTATGRGRAARPKTAQVTLGAPAPALDLPPLVIDKFAPTETTVDRAHNRAHNEPAAGSVPENRLVAPGPEIDLWANFVPNDPPWERTSRR